MTSVEDATLVSLRETRSTMIACSACGSQLTQGAAKCPGCGLSLVASAVAIRAPRKQPFLSGLQWAILLAGGFAIFVYAMDAISGPARAREAAARQAAEKATLSNQLALEDSVSNPTAFQARCGTATTIRHGVGPQDAKDLSSDHIHNAITLVYRKPQTEMHVIFTGDKTIPILFREHIDDKMYAYVPYDGLVELGCVKK